MSLSTSGATTSDDSLCADRNMLVSSDRASIKIPAASSGLIPLFVHAPLRPSQPASDRFDHATPGLRASRQRGPGNVEGESHALWPNLFFFFFFFFFGLYPFLTLPCHGRDLVHAILGVRASPLSSSGRADSQDPMDQARAYAQRVEERLTTSIGAGRMDGSSDDDSYDRRPGRRSHRTVNRQLAWYKTALPLGR